MKQLIKLSFVILTTLSVALISCSKSESSGGGTGGTGGGGVTPLSGFAQTNPDSGFKNFILTGIWSSNKPASYGSTTNATSGSFTVTLLASQKTSDVTIKDSVKLVSGNEIFYAPFYITIFSDDKKLLCWDDATNSIAVLRNTNTLTSRDSVNWIPGPLAGVDQQFYPRGTMQAINGGKAKYSIRYSGEVMYITLNAETVNAREYKVLSLSPYSFEIYQKDQSGTHWKIKWDKVH